MELDETEILPCQLCGRDVVSHQYVKAVRDAGLVSQDILIKATKIALE